MWETVNFFSNGMRRLHIPRLSLIHEDKLDYFKKIIIDEYSCRANHYDVAVYSKWFFLREYLSFDIIIMWTFRLNWTSQSAFGKECFKSKVKSFTTFINVWELFKAFALVITTFQHTSYQYVIHVMQLRSITDGQPWVEFSINYSSR